MIANLSFRSKTENICDRWPQAELEVNVLKVVQLAVREQVV